MLDQIAGMIEPYQKLFTTILRWQKAEKKIMDGAFLDLNAEETQAEVDDFGRELYKLVKTFTAKSKTKKKERDLGGGVRRADAGKVEQSADPPPLRMATGTLEHIKDFKVSVNLCAMYIHTYIHTYTHTYVPICVHFMYVSMQVSVYAHTYNYCALYICMSNAIYKSMFRTV